MLTIKVMIILACYLAWAAYRQPRWSLAWYDILLVVVSLAVVYVLILTGVIAP